MDAGHRAAIPPDPDGHALLAGAGPAPVPDHARERAAGSRQRQPTRPSLDAGGALLIGLGAAAMTLVMVLAYAGDAHLYLDNGDGVYLYAAQRLAQGATLYREVQATQPPLVYLLGAAVFKAGLGLPGIRLLAASLRACTTILIYLLARRLGGTRAMAAMCAALYTVLPIGLAWDRSYNANTPLTLAIVLSAWAAAGHTPRWSMASGLLAALALFAKDLYVPVLALTLLYLWHHGRLLLRPYIAGLAAGVLALGTILTLYAGVDALHDAFLGQGSSPFNPAWFVASVDYVAIMEGIAVLAAFVRVWRVAAPGRRSRARDKSSTSARRDDPPSVSPAGGTLTSEGTGPGERASSGTSGTPTSLATGWRPLVPYLLLGSTLILLATLKEGTFGTVFACAEPAVALGMGSAIAHAVEDIRGHDRYAPLATGLLLVLTLYGTQSAVSANTTLRASPANVAAVEAVAALISARAASGSTILEPPFYAVLTRTRVPGDVSDGYILAQSAAHGESVAAAQVAAMARMVAQRGYPIVVVDLRIAALGPVMVALRRSYTPASTDTLPPSVRSTVWLPRIRSR